MKTRFVQDLRPGEQIDELFTCRRKRLSTDRNGRPFLGLLLGDRSGEIEALMWSKADAAAELFEAGDVLRITGKVNDFQGRLQVHVSELARASADDGPADRLLPEQVADPAATWDALWAALDAVRRPALRALLARYRDDPELRGTLLAAPAASNHHHAFPGGLLVHTLSVIRVAAAMCDHYETELSGLLDRDVCLTGAFLHDLGKVWELRIDGAAIAYTDAGRLEGHLLLGLRDLERRMAGVEGLTEELAMALRHVVIAHHGQLQFGSPKEPMTAEALLVHAADKLDSELAAVHRILGQPRTGPWSGPEAPFHRFFYKQQTTDD